MAIAILSGIVVSIELFILKQVWLTAKSDSLLNKTILCKYLKDGMQILQKGVKYIRIKKSEI